MKRTMLLLSLISAVCALAPAQILSPGYDDGYVIRSASAMEVPNPLSSYVSVRLRSFSPGFVGLVSDNHTDLFRNPAIGLSDSASPELFGDLGSIVGTSRFNLGSRLRIPSGTLSVSLLLDRIEQRDRLGEELRYSESPTNWDKRTSGSKNLSERVGGRVAASFPLERGAEVGASYQFITSNGRSSAEYNSTSITPSYSEQAFNGDNLSSHSLAHIVRAGYIMPIDKNRLLLSAAGVFSTGDGSDASWNNFGTLYNYSTTASAQNQRLSTRAFSLEAILESKPDEVSTLRYLINLGMTSYSAPGDLIFVDSDTGSGVINSRTATGTYSMDGTITDARAGVGYERHLGDGFSGFIAASLGYLKNSGDGLASLYTLRYTSPPAAWAPGSTTQNATGAIKKWDVRVPIGAEKAFGEHITVRGGIEPRYQTTSTSYTSLEPERVSYYPPGNRYEATETTTRSLTFATQFGVSAYHQEYGEVSILFGRDLTETSLWTFFVMYYL